MSGKPNSVQIEELLSKIQKISQLEKEEKELEKKVQGLAYVRDELKTTHSEVRKLLESMDLTEVGNYGHLHRMVAFVEEVRRQILIDVKGEEEED